MMRSRFIKDLDQCKILWNTLIRPKSVSDLWEFRSCFDRRFRCPPAFLILEDAKGIAGMLPLSYSEETDRFVFFPGETWKGKTWMERTPFFLREEAYLPELFSSSPEKTFLRYIEPFSDLPPGDFGVDEIGYVLYPSRINFDQTLYKKRFSSKKFKNIMKTIGALTGPEGRFYLNRVEDFDLLVDMSLKCFGRDSYLEDHRFRDVMHLLHRKKWLRMVSLEIQGKTVAVDLGAIFGGTYTIFLGGTDRDVPGIAKVMNMHHIEFAFREGLFKVDFLCGDFNWKKLWHLDPEPLYKFVLPSAPARDPLEEPFLHETLGLLSRARTHV
jgi:hypothetical protein